ncbi:MAG: hypothetical protein QOI78_5569 [Actinomycetota bacterium]|nr:hypothetical protein [Actinomycetota bacterium]
MAGTAAAAALVLGPAAPVHAEKWKHTDATADVSVFQGSTTPVASPGSGPEDIRQLKVDYASHRVTFSVKTGAIHLVDGPPSISPAADPYLRLKDSNHQQWAIAVQEPLGSPIGTVTVTMSGAGQTVSCPGLTVVPDVAAATWVVRLKASCIGSPEWIKAGALILERGSFAQTLDDALKDGPSPYSLAPEVGARVHRN